MATSDFVPATLPFPVSRRSDGEHHYEVVLDGAVEGIPCAVLLEFFPASGNEARLPFCAGFTYRLSLISRPSALSRNAAH